MHEHDFIYFAQGLHTLLFRNYAFRLLVILKIVARLRSRLSVRNQDQEQDYGGLGLDLAKCVTIIATAVYTQITMESIRPAPLQ